MELLHVSDYIITDYSAIVYEAAITKKPIFFYDYDYEEYLANRGMYIDYKKEMPGPICKDIRDVMFYIQNKEYDKSKIENFCNKYVKKVDTNCTNAIVEFILKLIKETNNEV